MQESMRERAVRIRRKFQRRIDMRHWLAVMVQPRAVFAARWRLDNVLHIKVLERARLAAISEAWWWFGSVYAAASRPASRLFAPTPWRRIHVCGGRSKLLR